YGWVRSVMTCVEFQNLWQQRLDGAPLPERSIFERHLAECPDCRLHHAAAGRLEEGLRLLQLPAPPNALTRRIVDRLLAERQSRKLVRQRLLIAAAVAASVVIASVIGYSKWANNPTTPGPIDVPEAKHER